MRRFPPYHEIPARRDGRAAARADGEDLAKRVESLFGTLRHPGTDVPYTNADVARMSAGSLTERGVEEIRTGRIADPKMGQVAALAAVFGVEPSYLVDQKGQPVLDDEVMDDLADETAAAILRESARLPEREKRIVLGVVRQLGEER